MCMITFSKKDAESKEYDVGSQDAIYDVDFSFL